MIVGIGTDIIEINRVSKACKKESFLRKVFTEDEIRFFEGKDSRLAGNFAVKEAVAKSFGTGFRGFELKDIEVLRDELGKPYVNLYNNAKEKAGRLGVNKLHVSISNLKDYAQAFVVAEK